MPDVSENEIYLLLHLTPPAENYVAFSITRASTSDYTVERGTVVDGEFVSLGSDIITANVYQKTFLYDDWGDETSTSTRQVMLKITSPVAIESFNPSTHPARNYANFRGWNIVEFKGNLPECTSCIVGSSTAIQALAYLRYFSLEGSNSISSGVNMFYTCRSLIAVLALDVSKMTVCTNMFVYNTSLVALPQLNFDKATNALVMFSGAYSLFDASGLRFPIAQQVDKMFYNCFALKYPPTVLGGAGTLTNILSVYSGCYALETFELDITNVTSASTITTTNYNLFRILLTGTSPVFPANIVLAYSSIGLQAFREFAENLPDISSSTSRAITMTGTPAAIDQTSEEWLAIVAILNTKGWTVTV